MVRPVTYVVSFTLRAFPAGGREDVPLTEGELREYAAIAVKSWAKLVPEMSIDYERMEDVLLLVKKAGIRRQRRRRA